jgi:hypothetical protein
VQPVSDLDWLAGYLLLPGEQPHTIAQEVIEGKITVDGLRGPTQPVQPTATLLPTDLAPLQTDAAEEMSIASDRTPLDLLPIIVLLLLVMAAGVGGVFWRRRRNRSD